MAVPTEERLCVFCRKRPVDPAWRPFCGERCKILDLARWADGTYAVPGDRDDKQSEVESEEDKGKS